MTTLTNLWVKDGYVIQIVVLNDVDGTLLNDYIIREEEGNEKIQKGVNEMLKHYQKDNKKRELPPNEDNNMQEHDKKQRVQHDTENMGKREDDGYWVTRKEFDELCYEVKQLKGLIEEKRKLLEENIGQ